MEEWGRESFTPSKRTDTRFQRYLLSLTRFEAWMTDSFGDLGEFVAVNARMVQLATIIFTIVCSLCLWYFMEIETRPEELFVRMTVLHLSNINEVDQTFTVKLRTFTFDRYLRA